MQIKGSLISHFSNLVKLHGGINLAQGIPGFRPPTELMNILSKKSTENFHQYAPGIGNHKLLQLLKDEYKSMQTESEILITNGATEAISLIYTYLSSNHNRENFNVAAFSPAYESYIHLPKIFKNNFFTHKINAKYYFDELEFKEFFVSNKIKLFFISSPGNPFGKTLSKEQFDFLVNLAEEQNAYLIVDAVYSDLYFTESKPYYPINNISPNVFYVNSFSKKFSITGWRLGYFLMNPQHYTKMCYTHDYIGLCASSVLQETVSEYMANSDYLSYINKIKQKIKENFDYTAISLNNSGFEVPSCEGGYFVWAKLPEKFNDSLEFGVKLYDDTKTAIIPGIHFGNEWNNYIRINVAREKEELHTGLTNLNKFVR